jgi:DnaJ-class molecular chaperone
MVEAMVEALAFLNEDEEICPLCGGKGIIEEPCPECNGLYVYEWGSQVIRCSYYLCKRGRVEVVCPECGGEGFIKKDSENLQKDKEKA